MSSSVDTSSVNANANANAEAEAEADADAEHDASKQILHGVSQRDVYVGAPLKPAEGLFHEEFWVSMTISNQAKQHGKLTVFLGHWRASNIISKLYG
ncbi:hypothetical protein QQZ08_010140 [Neonectria magnoliae]|uniref:Uncharacterized protein n=1 Tax=Neonectria magnoliae TaxID=2732573 RepID=A0ABR1HJ63_9HYPO